MILRSRVQWPVLAAALFILFGLLAVRVPAAAAAGDRVGAAALLVNATADVVADDGQCTLREAITAANTDTPSGSTLGECAAGSGADTILLPAGQFTLALAGAGENANASGDLDITGDLTIAGAGRGKTFVRGGTSTNSGIDRVFHVPFGSNATVTLRDLAISNGRTPDGGNFFNVAGAGLFVEGHNAGVTLERVTVFFNRSGGAGGGIYAQAPLTVRDAQISDNSAFLDGGGIQAEGDVNLVNTTIAENTAGGTLGGGGVFFNGAAAATITIRNSTLAENGIANGSAGPAIRADANKTVNVQNSIITRHTGDECNRTLAGSNNLIDDASCGAIRLGAVSGLHLSLANNGGGNFTYALLPGSNAINAGSANCPDHTGAPLATDQRGYFRHDGQCDIGAFEVSDGPCAATHDNGLTALYTLDASAVQAAIAAAGANATVKVAGMCVGTHAQMSITQTVYISTSLTLEGGHTPLNWQSAADSALNPTWLDAAGQGRVVVLHNAAAAGTLQVTLGHLTLQNGVAQRPGMTFGGGLYIDANVVATLSNSTLAGNSATEGGGIYSFGTATVSNSTLADNAAEFGGGIYNVRTATVGNSTLAGNSAIFGGGIYNGDGGTATVSNSTLAGNSANRGGGIYTGGAATISNSTLSGNSANRGGGIYNFGLTTVGNSTLADNSAIESGGGIYNALAGTAAVNNSILARNSAAAGGGIYSLGTATVSDSTLADNSATDGNGGGISNFGLTTIGNSILSGNSAFAAGAGIYNDGTATVSRSTLSGNSTIDGGGIFNAGTGTLAIDSSTLSGNLANQGGSGGGISNFGLTTIGNSTLSDNTAEYGGGIASGVALTVTNSTLSGNSAQFGGGIYSYAGAATVSNSIIANSTNGDDCSGSAAPAFSYSLVEDGSCNIGGAGNLTGDPGLAALADNGGPTQTHALPGDSSAIDAGDPTACPATDQRGFVRSDGACDIGAFELGGVVPLSITLRAAAGAAPPPRPALWPLLLLALLSLVPILHSFLQEKTSP